MEWWSDTSRGLIELGGRIVIKRTDLELSFDGKRAAVDFTVPNTLKLKQRTPGHVYVP
jgi:hypothetical protein